MAGDHLTSFDHAYIQYMAANPGAETVVHLAIVALALLILMGSMYMED